jgi:hypothetical protein
LYYYITAATATTTTTTTTATTTVAFLLPIRLPDGAMELEAFFWTLVWLSEGASDAYHAS